MGQSVCVIYYSCLCEHIYTSLAKSQMLLPLWQQTQLTISVVDRPANGKFVDHCDACISRLAHRGHFPIVCLSV